MSYQTKQRGLVALKATTKAPAARKTRPKTNSSSKTLKISVKQKPIRASRARRGATANAPARYLNAMGAPVATNSLSSRTYFRVTSAGDTITVHCCDRIQGGVTMPLGSIDIPDINYSGSVLLKVALNPSSLGERLRRLASNFELYNFTSMQVHYSPALGTMTNGSLLGFYDADPADEFDAGERSLAEAAAHPLSHSVKVWEDGVWVMPRRPPGRFYIDRNGSSNADLRLQDQGNFRIMVDVPLTDSTLPTTDYVLGSIYIEYQCVLMKPTIQPNFIGTADLFTMQEPLSALTFSGGTNLNIINSFAVAGNYMVPDKRNNGGCNYAGNLISNQFAISIPEGLWNVAVHARYTTTATTSILYSLLAAEEVGGASNPANVSDGLTPPGYATVTGVNTLEFSSTGAISTPTAWSWGCQMLVPSAQFRYLTLAANVVTGTIDISDLHFSFTMALPSASQSLLLNPSSNLSERLLTLERRLVQMNRNETKREMKSEGVTTPRSVTASGIDAADGEFVGYPILPPGPPVLKRQYALTTRVASNK